jgi:hypothetical protein
VLSGRGLCDELITRPEESYRLCCIVVYYLETSGIGAPYVYDISHLRVKWVMEAVSAEVKWCLCNDNYSPLYSVKFTNKLRYCYTTSQCSEEKVYLFYLLRKMFGPKERK